MSKPCAVFWYIQNTVLPIGQTVDSILKLIRSTLIKAYNLEETFFFCVCACDIHKFISSDIEKPLTNLDVDIVQANNDKTDSAVIKIMDLMKKFVKLAGQDCSIILLSGDDEYCGTLSDLKNFYNISIHLIRLDNSFSPKLDQISDYIYVLNLGVLESVKSNGLSKYFISISNYPLTMDINCVMTTLNSQTIGSIQKSAILFRDTICIGFPTLGTAERAVEKLNGLVFEDSLKVELIADSPLTEILKFISHDVTGQTKRYDEVKQLTFIKMNNSKESVDISKTIKFCIACTAQSGSQCILSSESFIWIVFSLKSDAQEFLPKLQIIYPDAVITEPPIDLTLKCEENLYTVKSCNKKVTNAEPTICASLDVPEENDLKIFFGYDSNFCAPMLYYQPTKWSLLFDLFEQLYDLGAKKVIFDGNLYCAHFDSASAYKDALGKMSSRYLEPLEVVKVSETYKQEVTKKINQYKSMIPWCLNQELGLYCSFIKIKSQFHEHFIEISKHILGNREAIFMKSTPEGIWIGFPDELTCKATQSKLLEFSANTNKENSICFLQPWKELLESIDFQDLAGNAYDLAFLSSRLQSLKPITRPLILERISLQTEEREFNQVFFYINVQRKFVNSKPWVPLSIEQSVKILVNFSKVIPLAVGESYSNGYNHFYLIYNTWYEAHAARYFINNLIATEVPYLQKLEHASEVYQLKSAFSNIYYIINDKRKVLDKIVQNKNRMDKLNSDSSTAQSTSDNEALEQKCIRKSYLFTVITDSEFKFTSGMISMIKMKLIEKGCEACVKDGDQILVRFDELKKGNKAKDEIEKIKFKILHEKDHDDFEVGVVMKLIKEIESDGSKMPTETFTQKTYPSCDAYPLGHFNYNYKRAVGMSISRYCKLHELQ